MSSTEEILSPDLQDLWIGCLVEKPEVTARESRLAETLRCVYHARSPKFVLGRTRDEVLSRMPRDTHLYDTTIFQMKRVQA